MDFDPYSVGICAASVCTNLSDAEATNQLNASHPTGISSQWRVSKDKTFIGGQANGCACPDKPPGFRHILFTC